MIMDFWVHAECTKNGPTLESTVQGVKIVITEAIIREVLKLNDQDTHPLQFSEHQIKGA